MIEAGENLKVAMYKALLSNYLADTKIHDNAPFYHGRKRVARRVLEVRLLVTRGLLQEGFAEVGCFVSEYNAAV
jgi:hypothetical protein